MVHIVGAGIAGLTLADALDALGVRWKIYDRESRIGIYASGKNAGIIRTYESDAQVRAACEKSLEYYRAHEPSFVESGLLINPWDIDYAYENAPRRVFSHGRSSGIWLEKNGTVNPMRVVERLSEQTFSHGEILWESSLNLEPLSDYVSDPTAIYVVAAGEGASAYASALGRERGIQLIPHRRSLYEFKVENAAAVVEWDEHTGVYWRLLENGNVLATAGEQIANAPEPTAPDENALSVLAKINPALSRERLVSWRSCYRVVSIDSRPIAKRDEFYNNLFWFVGLGGRGMSVAPALAAALASEISAQS